MAKKNGSTTAVPPNMVLSEVELTLIRNVRNMNDQGQHHINSLATLTASKYPRHITPSLRLIAGGAK